MKYQADKWIVKVFQKGDYAYAKSFRTKKLAGAFCNEIGNYGANWSTELVSMKPIKIKATLVDGFDVPLCMTNGL
jgi:hypothetical protein